MPGTGAGTSRFDRAVVLPLQSGDMETIGPYRVIQRLGGGRHTRVFQCEADGAHYAVKHFTPSERRRKREIRRRRPDPRADWKRKIEWEADVLATVESPAVVPLVGRGEDQNAAPYFAMPFYRESIAEKLWGTRIPQIKCTPLGPAQAVAILRDIVTGARDLHRAGIVHRDLKPQNVLLTADGRAAICDLGQAQSDVHGVAEPISNPGTYPYVAPELRNGASAVDGRTDIYAIALIGHLMLAGYLPENGAPLRDTDHPPALIRWIEAGLDSNPANRPEAYPEN